MSRVILYFLRQQFSLFTACSMRHCGTSACWHGLKGRVLVLFAFNYILCLVSSFFSCSKFNAIAVLSSRAFLVIFWRHLLRCSDVVRHVFFSLDTFFNMIIPVVPHKAGGSFKNRKPIGEVGCCESRMAKRSHWWTERWLMSPLFLSLSLSFSDYLPTYLPPDQKDLSSVQSFLCGDEQVGRTKAARISQPRRHEL